MLVQDCFSFTHLLPEPGKKFFFEPSAAKLRFGDVNIFSYPQIVLYPVSMFYYVSFISLGLIISTLRKYFYFTLIGFPTTNNRK